MTPNGVISSERVNMLKNFVKKERLTWDNCIDVCTDGEKLEPENC